uniref:doubled motif LPXTG anchor domain-containing protein n=3 Tax=Lachnospiraceae TaxID=186803 RepID=UPI00336C133A
STSGVTTKTYRGWKLSSITINGEEVESLPATVNNGDAVVYNYEKETYDYIVEYYKGTLDSENKIGTSEKLSAKYLEPIILDSGTDNGQLDSMRPAGYSSGVQQEAPYIMGEKDNIIKVLYVAEEVDYVVHMYYQTDGSYPDFDKATYVDIRQGLTDSEVEVTANDLIPVREGYVLDADAIGNRYKGTVIAGEEYLILRVYFKQQFTVTYEPGTYGIGIFDTSVTNELDYGSNTPVAPITELGTPGTGGYVFAGWEPKVEPTVTKDATYVAQWIPSDSTKYTVEFYYENAGKYPAAPDDISLRAGTTDATGAVTDTDKAAPAGYILDPNAANVFEAKITGDGNMVLRIYFKQQFTVTYNPGEHGSFDAQSNSGLSYGDKTPAFSGQTTANGNYSFNGWDKEIAETVTGNAVYTALWSYNSSTGGGGGGGGGGNPGRVTPSTDGGPGAVTIMPEDVPLAQLPGSPVDPTVIDDGEIPLAALPKTGQSSVKSTLTMMMSGIFLMLTAMSKKRKEEDS